MCREFKVLPTDPRVQSMTNNQIDWVLTNLFQDQRELEAVMAKTEGVQRTVYEALEG